MYIVKRSFRNLGKVYTAGEVIAEPAVIKRFKGKVAEGKIVDVTEHNYNNMATYFKTKYGVVIPPLSKEEPYQKAEPDQKTEPVAVKAVVAKATSTK